MIASPQLQPRDELQGAKALADAFGLAPRSSVLCSDAQICLWSTQGQRYEHTDCPDLLIGLLSSGDVCWRNNRNSGAFHHGRVSVMPAGTCIKVEPNGPIASTTVHISSNRVRETFQIQDEHMVIGPRELRMGMHEPLMAHALLALTQEIAYPRENGSLFVDSLVDILLYQSIRMEPEAKSPSAVCGLAPYILKRITDHIFEEVAAPHTLADLAKLADLNPHYFSRMFKASTGISPHQFVTRARVDRAKELLRTTSKSISEIAMEVGFSSHSHLCDTFRKITGFSPTKFRQKRLFTY